MSPGQPSFEPGPGQRGQLRDLAYEPTRSGAKSLLVFVPGLLAERLPYAELLSRLEQDLGQDWRVLWWDSGLRWWSRRPMAEAGHRLRVRLRTEWDDIGGLNASCLLATAWAAWLYVMLTCLIRVYTRTYLVRTSG